MKARNDKNKIILIVLGVLIIIIGGIFIYNIIKENNGFRKHDYSMDEPSDDSGKKNTKDDKKKDSEKEEDEEKETTNFVDKKTEPEKMDVNDPLVLKLYNPFYRINIPFSLDSAKSKIYKESDIKDSIKWQIGMKEIGDSEINKIECSTLDPRELFSSNDLTTNAVCGQDNYYNPKTKRFENIDNNNTTTKIIKETIVKDKIERIFGPNSYHRMDKETSLNQVEYVYLDRIKSYVNVRLDGKGGASAEYKSSLVKAEKDKNCIIITEEVTYLTDFVDEKNNESYNFIYSFQLNQDGNYYFDSLTITKK